MSAEEHEGVPLLRNISGKDVFHLLNVITAMDHAMEHTQVAINAHSLRIA